jgi:hypothetical protein
LQCKGFFASRWHWPTVLLVSLLFMLPLAVFGRVVTFELIEGDDTAHIENNPHIHPPSWSGLFHLWRAPYLREYIPVTYTFFAAEVWVSRQVARDAPLRGGIFHAGNLLIHVLNGILVFALAFNLSGNRTGAWLGATVFALHPLQVQSVAWVSETRGTLATFFSLVALLQYWRWSKDLCSAPQAGSSNMLRTCRLALTYGTATVAFVLAVLSKPSAVALPLLAIVIDRFATNRPMARSAIRAIPWCLVSLAVVLVTRAAQPDEHMRYVPPLWLRFPVAGDALAFYLQKLVIPFHLKPDYHRSPLYVSGHLLLQYTWVVPAGLAVWVYGFSGNRLLKAAFTWFVIALLPVLGLIPFGYQDYSTVADRYVYLAMAGVALAVAAVAGERRDMPFWAAISVVAVLGVLSWLQTANYRNTQTFLEWKTDGQANRGARSNEADDTGAGRYSSRKRCFPAANGMGRCAQFAGRSRNGHLTCGGR